MIFYNRLFQIFLFSLFGLFGQLDNKVSGYSVILDTIEDTRFLSIGWAINGSQYLANGSELERTFDREFPPGFNYAEFMERKGFWVLTPPSPNSLDESRTFDLGYQTSAQLLSSMSIFYCLNGLAQLTIRRHKREPPLFIMSASHPNWDPEKVYQCFNTSLQFELSSEFQIEGLVVQVGDFILVDRVQGDFHITPPRPHPSLSLSLKDSTAAGQQERATRHASRHKVLSLIEITQHLPNYESLLPYYTKNKSSHKKPQNLQILISTLNILILLFYLTK